jgi:hypothetical protein
MSRQGGSKLLFLLPHGPFLLSLMFRIFFEADKAEILLHYKREREGYMG